MGDERMGEAEVERFRTFSWYWWRFKIARDNPRRPTIYFAWGDGYKLQCYSTFFVWWPCPHRRIEHVVNRDLTEMDQCQACGECFNYDLTPEWAAVAWPRRKYRRASAS